MPKFKSINTDGQSINWFRHLFIILVLIGLVTLVVTSRYDNDSGRLNVGIQYRGATFFITNKNDLPWRRLQVILNRRYIPQRSSLSFDILAPGQTAEIPLNAFATRDGQRLYLTDPLQNLEIKAVIDGQEQSSMTFFR